MSCCTISAPSPTARRANPSFAATINAGTQSHTSTCIPITFFLVNPNYIVNVNRLALNMLPDEVYDTEWDLIMIDAPRGYFAEAPGRMAAIYSAAVMARNRNKSGVTHVFLHDVDRRVEKLYAEEFLCKKHLVKAVGRLWHFEIPPAANVNAPFC